MQTNFKYLIRRTLEIIKYSFYKEDKGLRFYIVSCQRNAGEYTLRCLESVRSQNFDQSRITHIFIDDASDDNTDEIVQDWIKNHTNNLAYTFIYKRNTERAGLCRNNYEAFMEAEPSDICIELNGDDWLPDPDTLSFLAKVYSDKNVWMTYNTFRYSDGRMGACNNYKNDVIRNNAYRDCPRWLASHLHSFRAALFFRINQKDFIDPETGTYWESAVDRAFYYPMYEMAGRHAKHLCRINYIYNLRDISHETVNRKVSEIRAERIARLPKYAPLATLDFSTGKAAGK